MSRLIVLCAWLLPVFDLSLAAETAGDPMSVYYENTLTCQGSAADNWLCYYWYYPGGYYRELQVIRRRDGNIALHGREGTFKLRTTREGTVLCQTLNGDTRNWCRTLTSRKLGDLWEERLANDKPQMFRLLAGREVADVAFNLTHNGQLQALSGRGEDAHVVALYQYQDYPPDSRKVMRDVGAASR